MSYTPESFSTPITASDGGDDSPTTMDHLIDTTDNLHITSLPPPPPNPFMGLTENASATYITSTNPCVDFFFQIVPDSPSERLIQLLQLSWTQNPLTTLKLICNLRGVRGTGKSDKENFYTSALWLHENHPKTLACNVEKLAKFGYFKDLLEILYRILVGSNERKERKEEWFQQKRGKGKGQARKYYFLAKKAAKKAKKEEDSEEAVMRKRLRVRVPREKRVAENAEKVKLEMEKARALRKEKDLNMAKRANERYISDENYRFLHDQISGLFAKLLKSDKMCLSSGEMKKITLAAKWCPSIDSSYDKATLLCKSIAERTFPREEYEGVEESVYVNMARNRLRKEVLVPLHQALKLPEVYMSAKRWESIEYERVASVAMKNYTDIFLLRDNKRFKEYLEKVNTGEAKIAAGALLPHEIIGGLKKSNGARIVAELQWKRMVDDLLKKGKLTNCIGISDVSGSMNGIPMEVSVALGLLISELTEEPWKGKLITFSEDPQVHEIKGKTLIAKTDFIRQMDWGMNTNFQKAFDKILEIAVNAKLTEDEMIKRVFVFSDMEFDQACVTPWKTDYDVIQKNLKEKGFEKVPEIVFWNLRDSSSTPVTATQDGVALVSGYSKNLLTLFLEEGGSINPEDGKANAEEDSSENKEEMNPESVMDAAISGDLYQKLVVYD